MEERCVFILLNSEVTIYHQINTQSKWSNLPVSGEHVNTINSSLDLKNIIEKANDGLNRQNKLKDIEILVFYSQSDIKLIENISVYLTQFNCEKWQILYWEALFNYANTVQKEPTQCPILNEDWLIDFCLPCLDNLLLFKEIDEKIIAEDKYQIKKLKEKQEKLQHEIELLQLRLSAKPLASIEKLLTFLPIIYYNFWTHIKPSDLALLAGTHTIPEIPTPYPEPDTHTIAIMKNRWKTLSEDEQQQIRYFCQELNYPNLKMRPEMRFIVKE